jgi:hypothetical protein
MYVIAWKGGYLKKRDGCNSIVAFQSEASVFLTIEDARAARVGHDKAMGGNGYSGTIMLKEYYEN